MLMKMLASVSTCAADILTKILRSQNFLRLLSKVLGNFFVMRKMVKALLYLLAEIKRLNTKIEREHRRITSEKQKVEGKDISK